MRSIFPGSLRDPVFGPREKQGPKAQKVRFSHFLALSQKGPKTAKTRKTGLKKALPPVASSPATTGNALTARCEGLPAGLTRKRPQERSKSCVSEAKALAARREVLPAANPPAENYGRLSHLTGTEPK